jgi:hypothetical protein
LDIIAQYRFTPWLPMNHREVKVVRKESLTMTYSDWKRSREATLFGEYRYFAKELME